MSYYNLQYKVQPEGYNMGQMHSHEFFEIEFLLSGVRRYYEKSQMYEMKAPTLIVIPPNALHKFESCGCEVYTLQISTESLNGDQINFLKRFSKKRVARFPLQKLASFKAIYESLNSIYSSFPFDARKKTLFGVYLGKLFYMMYSYAKSAGKESRLELKEDLNPTINPVILKVLDYLRRHYTEDFTLGDLSKTFHVSKSYLSSSFAKATGSAIFQYKLSLQLSEAKRLLKETNYSYDKIAEITGFSSGNYFRLIFKKHEGQTPNKLRKKPKEKRIKE